MKSYYEVRGDHEEWIHSGGWRTSHDRKTGKYTIFNVSRKEVRLEVDFKELCQISQMLENVISYA